jgi:tetratricopeptide (TPR) repeat protein
MYRDASRRRVTDSADGEPISRGRNFIVAIGIDSYTFWSKLRNAVADAQGIHKLFVEKFGFVAPAVEPPLPLLDDKATKKTITDLVEDQLRTCLQEDDTLLLFFAGHGHTRVDKVGSKTIETGYIVPVGARFGEATYYGDLIEIDSFLETVARLPARHILVILDSCHSGFGLGKAMQISRSAARYEQDLVRRVSRKVITSARREQLAVDQGPLPGNSLFTGTLINGLTSKEADYDHNSIVTSSELGLYLQQQVGQTSESKQTPDFGSFHLDDRGEMALSFKLEDIETHSQLGRRLSEMGWLLDDAGRFQSAIRHFDEALKLSPELLPEAFLGRGKARYALRQYREALGDFSQAEELDKALAEASLYRGLAHARLGERESAVAALTSFIENRPDDATTPWLKELVVRLSSPPTGVKRALLIAIADYVAAPRIPNLRGPLNDLQIMRGVLTQRLGFPEQNITELVNTKATREGILKALAALQAKAQPGDTVVIYYSGHAMQADAPTYLIPHDTAIEPSGGLRNTIDAKELHELLNSIPAQRKTVILDTHSTWQFIELVQAQAKYTLFLASSPETQAYEHVAQVGKKQRVPVGLFTYAFTKQLEQAAPDTRQGEIADGVAREVLNINAQQRPQFFGRRDRPLFGGEAAEEPLAAFDLSLRQNFAAFSLPETLARYTVLRHELGDVPFPELHYQFGCAFVEKGAYRDALTALQKALDQRQSPYPDACLQLGIAQLRLQRYQDAQATFRRYLEAVPDARGDMQEPLELIGQLLHDHKYAVLVGIDDYYDREPLHGAVNDVAALKRVLIEKYGFLEEDVGLLVNGQATTKAITEALKGLAARAREAPALFYFAGAGWLGSGESLSIVGVDTRGNAIPLDLRLLRESTAGTSSNLVTIFDAGWARGVTLPWGTSWGSRFHEPGFLSRGVVPPSSPQQVGPAWQPDPAWLEGRERIGAVLRPLAVGRLTIYQVSIQAALGAGRPDGTDAVVETELPALDGGWKREVHGVLTHALVASLQQADPMALTYRQLAESLEDRLQWLQPYLVGDNLDEKVFSNPVKEEKAYALVKQRILQEPVRQTITLLHKVIEQQDDTDPESHLDLGVAYAALDDYDNSIKALNKAIDQRGEEYPEAHYHLGRVLYTSKKDLDLAVSELHKAKQYDSAAVYYYLGQAIRARVAQQSEALGEAQRAFETYVERGAPIGQREEVERLLEMGYYGTGTGTDPYETVGPSGPGPYLGTGSGEPVPNPYGLGTGPR